MLAYPWISGKKSWLGNGQRELLCVHLCVCSRAGERGGKKEREREREERKLRGEEVIGYCLVCLARVCSFFTQCVLTLLCLANMKHKVRRRFNHNCLLLKKQHLWVVFFVCLSLHYYKIWLACQRAKLAMCSQIVPCSDTSERLILVWVVLLQDDIHVEWFL